MTPKSFYYPTPTGGPTLWQPSDLPGLVAYYTAQDATSLTLGGTGGTDVLEWRPQYGETNWDLTPVNVNAYDAAGINGLPTVESTANNAYMQTANILNLTDISISLIVNYSNVDRQGFLVGNNNLGFRLHDFGSEIYAISGNVLSSEPPQINYGGGSVLMMVMFSFDSVNQLLTGNLNGTDIGVDTPRNNLTGTPDTFKVFASPPNPNNPDVLNSSKMGAVIVTNNALSLDEREKTMGFLAHDWNATSLLPAAHPYKDNPPTV